MQLILASESRYKHDLLARLKIPFKSVPPMIDETPLPDESPLALVERLAFEKAAAISGQLSDTLIIGCDQIALLNGKILGKPGTTSRAISQLQNCSGKQVSFMVGLCLLNTNSRATQKAIETFNVTFRQLSKKQIARYVKLDNPLDCAASFKWESLGISLLQRMSGDDVTTLEGLPLIKLTEMLEREGIQIL